MNSILTSFRSFFSFFFLGGGSSGGGGRCDFFSLLGLKISCFLSMKYLEYCSEYHFDLINVLSISELTSSKKVKVSENDIKALVSIFLKPNLFSVAPPDAESKCTGALQVFQSFSIKIQNIYQI